MSADAPNTDLSHVTEVFREELERIDQERRGRALPRVLKRRSPEPPVATGLTPLQRAVEMMRWVGASYRGVARELNLSVDEVRRAAKAAGIVRPRGVPKGLRRAIKIDDDVLRAMVAAGRSPKEMADRFDCSKQAIWDARKRLGLLK